MQTDTLIIGQGICGTWLSYWLNKAGADFLIIDEEKPNSASRVASGVINPVTGRRMVKTWMADELLPFSSQSYSEMGAVLEREIISDACLLDFFAAPDRRLSFEKRSQEFETYLNWPSDENEWRHLFDYPFGFGMVNPVYQVNLQAMLPGWRHKMESEGKLINERYEANSLELTSHGIQYKEVAAKKIVFCDGTAVMEQPYFNLLPFAFNKGEALIIDAQALPQNYIFKKTNTITPWQNGLFWVGSTYNRDFEDEQPTPSFYNGMNQWLNQFLKVPFTIVDHLAAIRPTTVERRPFAGFHPRHLPVGILNGMGTKGVSLAPLIAKQLCDHILFHKPIMKEADVNAYTRLLVRL